MCTSATSRKLLLATSNQPETTNCRHGAAQLPQDTAVNLAVGLGTTFYSQVHARTSLCRRTNAIKDLPVLERLPKDYIYVTIDQ